MAQEVTARPKLSLTMRNTGTVLLGGKRPSALSTSFPLSLSPSTSTFLLPPFSSLHLLSPLFLLSVSPPLPSLTVKLSVWGSVMNCPVWLCIWPMPTHGRGLSSGSIDELTLKDDSACLAHRRERKMGGSECACVCVCRCGFGTYMGVNAHVFQCMCVFVFFCMSGPAKPSGREGRWKGKVFKGHMYLSIWVLLHCYSYQYSAVIPDLVHQPTKPLLSALKKKPLFSSSSWSYSTLMKWSIVCLFCLLRSLKGSLGSRGHHWFFLITPGDSDKFSVRELWSSKSQISLFQVCCCGLTKADTIPGVHTTLGWILSASLWTTSS